MGSLIPRCSRFFGDCSDLRCFGALRLVASSRPIAFRASGQGDLAFFSHVAQLSTIETGEWFLIAIRGPGFPFSFSESVDLHLGFLIRSSV